MAARWEAQSRHGSVLTSREEVKEAVDEFKALVYRTLRQS